MKKFFGLPFCVINGSVIRLDNLIETHVDKLPEGFYSLIDKDTVDGYVYASVWLDGEFYLVGSENIKASTGGIVQIKNIHDGNHYEVNIKPIISDWGFIKILQTDGNFSFRHFSSSFRLQLRIKSSTDYKSDSSIDQQLSFSGYGSKRKIYDGLFTIFKKELVEYSDRIKLKEL
jgi:hypothetical protein